MTIPLSAAGELVLDGKNITTYYKVEIAGIDRTSKVLSYSYGFNRQFGAAQAIIVLNNDAGEFSPGGANEIFYNDTVQITEGFQVSGSPESWSKFYGLVRQRPVRNNQGDNTIQLTALDYICRLYDLEIDETFESSNKVDVVDEELTGNSIVGYTNMADLWTIANDNIADEPTPILRLENKENFIVQPKVDGYEVDYETGQITTNPINKNTHKVLLTYSHYTSGLFIEDIIESILTAVDGYGNSVFTTATNLTTNYTTERGGSTDTLTPNYVTQTIDGTDYPAGQVWYMTFNNVSTTLVAGDFTVPGATISALSQRYGRIILNTAISTSATVTYNQNYTFKTLQASGIEVAKVSFSFKDTRSRFDAIVQLRKLCVDKDTEALTKTGWKKYNEINIGDDIYTFNMDNGMGEWAKVEHMTKYEVDEDLIEMKTESFDALVIKEHNWVVKPSYAIYEERSQHRKKEGIKKDYYTKFRLRPTTGLKVSDHIIRKAKFNDKNKIKKYDDNFVKLVGWFISEGCYISPNKDRKKIQKNKSYGRINISQSEKVNFEKCKIIEKVLNNLEIKYNKNKTKKGMLRFDFFGKMVKKIVDVTTPNKKLTYSFINELTYEQKLMLTDSLVLGDGQKWKRVNYYSTRFFTSDKDNADAFLYLLVLSGKCGSISKDERDYSEKPHYIQGVKVKKDKYVGYIVREINNPYSMVQQLHIKEVPYKGIVWCPSTKNKTFLMRRKGKVTFTGNCAPNYLLRTKGTNKIWAEFLNQKFTEDYTLKLMSSLSYLDDQDIYTRVKLFGKNSNPTNLVTRGASMKADATEYEGYAHAQVLGYFSGYDESSSILYDITRVAETRYTDFTNWTLGGSMTRATTGYKTSPNCLYINGGASGFALSPEITLNSGAELIVLSGLIKWSNSGGVGAGAYAYADPYRSLEKAYCGIRLKEYDTNHTLIRTTFQKVAGENVSQWQRLEHRFDLHSSASYVRAEFVARQGLPGYSEGGSNPAVDLSGLGAAKLNVNIDGAGAQEISLTPANLTSSWKIAEEIQTKLRAIGTGGYAEATCQYLGSDISVLVTNVRVAVWDGTLNPNSYLIKSGTTGASSSVVVTNAAADNVADDLKLGVANGGTERVGEVGFTTITAYCDNVAIVQGKDAVTTQPYEDGGAEVIFNARPYEQSELRIREDDTHPVNVYINKVPIKNQRHQIVAEKVRVIEKVTTTTSSGK